VSPIFVTGANGYVGRHLLKRPLPEPMKLRCLSRESGNVDASVLETVEYVRADLAEPARYERMLASADCVLHLAAATGKVKPGEYFRTNVEGTRILVEQCRRAGVKRFLYVSSVAVKFPRKERYFYAQSKEQAEEIVRGSGLRYTIVRPTMILGRRAPVWTGLAKLARLPVVPVFGDGRARIQPIDVDDLVDFLLAVMERDRFQGETLEFGGPEVISIEDFLKKAHAVLRGGASRTVHIPLGLVLPALIVLEKLAYAAVPITVGQIASFRCDGIIQPNNLFEERAAQLKTIDQMLSVCAQ
jgi:NADH dehydrogenase